MKWLEHRIPPPILFIVAAALAWLVARLLPWPAAGTMLRYPLAAVMLSIAMAFGPLAFIAFRRAGTTIDPVRIAAASGLVTSGVYALSRNPMYVSLTALLAAWVALLGSAAAAFVLVLFAVYLNRFQIQPEERALHAKFGADYDIYRTRVRRWL